MYPSKIVIIRDIRDNAVDQLHIRRGSAVSGRRESAYSKGKIQNMK